MTQIAVIGSMIRIRMPVPAQRRIRHVVKIRAVSDPSVMEYRPQPAKPRQLSPRAQARLEQDRLFRRKIVNRLTDETKVFRIKLGLDEKALTVRRRLGKVADDAGKEIAIRQVDDVLYVGLMTPERRPRRGRKPKPRA
jgi:hypothetical protein